MFHRNVFMMRTNCIDDDGMFIVFLRQFIAKKRMRAFDTSIDGLTDVVHESGSFGQNWVNTEFRSDDAAEISNFNAVL